MLSTDASVAVLSPARKHELPAAMVGAMGGEASPMAECPPGFLTRFILGQVRSALYPQTKTLGFDVSDSWLATQKAAAAAAGEADVPYVSTNDCVVPCFGNCLRPDCMLMAINFQGRLEGCGAEDVGNYGINTHTAHAHTQIYTHTQTHTQHTHNTHTQRNSSPTTRRTTRRPCCCAGAWLARRTGAPACHHGDAEQLAACTRRDIRCGDQLVVVCAPARTRRRRGAGAPPAAV